MSESKIVPDHGSDVRMGKNASDQSVWRHYVERSAGGDQGAFASLYDASRRLLYATALRIVGEPADAEEVTLGVYLQVRRKAKEYTDRRGTVVAWLVMLARSRAIDRVPSRASRWRWEEPFQEFAQFPSTGPDHNTEAVHRRYRLAAESVDHSRAAVAFTVSVSLNAGAYASSLSMPPADPPAGTIIY